MTKLDFPDTPSTGQQYGSSGTSWRWDGSRWGSTSGAMGTRGTQAYQQITAAQNGFTSAGGDVAGLRVVFPVTAGRQYLITAAAHMLGSAVGVSTQLRLTDDAGNRYQVAAETTGSITNSEKHHVEFLWTPTTSGNGIYKVMAWVASGTVNVIATPEYPAFIMVQDVTYEAGSSVSTGAGAVPLFANKAALDLYVPPNGSGMAQTAFPPTTWTYYNGVWYPTSGMMPAMTLASNTTAVPHGTPLSVSWNSNIGLQNHFQPLEDSGRALRIPFRGVYQFHLSVSWAPNNTGSRVAMIKSQANHIYAISSHYAATANYGGGTIVSFVGPMAKDTVLYCDLIQDSGVSVGLSTQNAGGWGTTWSAAYLGIM